VDRGDVDPDLFGDDRVKTYWDPEGLVGDTIARDVGAGWDVYAVYGADARWGARPEDSGAPVIAESDRLGQTVEALATS